MTVELESDLQNGRRNTCPPHAVRTNCLKSSSYDPLLVPSCMIKCFSDSDIKEPFNYESEEMKCKLQQKLSQELEDKTKMLNRARYKSMLSVPRDLHSALHLSAITIKGFDHRSHGSKKSTVYNVQVERAGIVSYIFRRYSEFEKLHERLTEITLSMALENDLPHFPSKHSKPMTLFHKAAESDSSSSFTLKLNLYKLLSPSKTTLKTYKDQKIFLISRLNHYFECILRFKDPLRTAILSDSIVDSFFRQTLDDLNDESFYLKIAQKSGVDLLLGSSMRK